MKRLLIVGGFCCFFVLAILSYWLFFDWSRHKDELLTQADSPDGRYTVELYASNSHATTPAMILGVLIDQKTGKQTKIYWAKGHKAMLQWEDTRTITINNKTLTIPYNTYDYRDDKER